MSVYVADTLSAEILATKGLTCRQIVDKHKLWLFGPPWQNNMLKGFYHSRRLTKHLQTHHSTSVWGLPLSSARRTESCVGYLGSSWTHTGKLYTSAGLEETQFIRWLRCSVEVWKWFLAVKGPYRWWGQCSPLLDHKDICLCPPQGGMTSQTSSLPVTDGEKKTFGLILKRTWRFTSTCIE